MENPRRPRSYPDEFKAEALRQVRTSGRSVRQLAEELGITRDTLAQWVRESEQRPSGKALDAEERAELLKLRRRVRILEIEREILKKAAAFFASENERTR